VITLPVRFTIYGEPASKANSRREAVNPRTGRRMVIKSAKALSWQEAALQQIPPAARVQLSANVRVDMRIYYASQRPDLDESLILDVLQDQFVKIGGLRVVSQRGVYHNDRQVREKHIYHAIDKKNPRTVIQITEIQT
jgi:Holliday junction resolvase RusA-like endonuclease